MTLQETDTLSLATGVRLQFDKTRDTWMLLAPERAVKLDEIATAILQETDGQKTIGETAKVLADKYKAPVEVIQKDVVQLLQTLMDKRMLESVNA